MALLQIDPGIVIWTWLAFIIVAVILCKSTWKSILKGLNARSDKINEDLANAEKTREDAKKSLVAYREKIDNVKQEASSIIENSRVEATRIKEKMIAEAQTQIELNKEKSLKEIERAEQDALENIKDQAVNMASAMAESILRREVTNIDHNALIKEFESSAKKNGE